MDSVPIQTQTLRTTILSVIGIYIIGMILIGYYFHRRGVDDAQDYFLAGKSLPWYLVALSFFATGIGAGGTIGLSGDTYLQGTISTFWSYGIVVVGYFLAAFILGRRLPNTTGITIPEILSDRYNELTRAVSAPFYILRLTSSLAAQWVAGGILLNYLLGDLVTPEQGIVIAAIIVLIYTSFGGMFAVVWTDLIQSIIIFSGLWILTIIGIQELGGWSSMVTQATNVAPQAFNLFATDLSLIAGFVVTLMPTMLIRQQYLQRIMAARSPRDGVVGVAANGVISSVFIVTPLLIGLIGLVILGPGIENADVMLPRLINNLLPVWLAGFLLAALVAAIMSSADSALVSGASNLTQDYYIRHINPDPSQRDERWASRASIAILMIISVTLTTLIPGIIELLVFGALAITSGILVPFLGTFYWPRATGDAAFWSIVLGSGSAILWWTLGSFAGVEEYLGLHPVFIGLPLSFIAYFGISYLQEPEYQKVLETAQKHSLEDLEEKTRRYMDE